MGTCRQCFVSIIVPWTCASSRALLEWHLCQCDIGKITICELLIMDILRSASPPYCQKQRQLVVAESSTALPTMPTSFAKSLAGLLHGWSWLIITSRGDAHCFLYSISSSWNNQFHKEPPLEYSRIKDVHTHTPCWMLRRMPPLWYHRLCLVSFVVWTRTSYINDIIRALETVSPWLLQVSWTQRLQYSWSRGFCASTGDCPTPRRT